MGAVLPIFKINSGSTQPGAAAAVSRAKAARGDNQLHAVWRLWALAGGLRIQGRRGIIGCRFCERRCTGNGGCRRPPCSQFVQSVALCGTVASKRVADTSARRFEVPQSFSGTGVALEVLRIVSGKSSDRAGPDMGVKIHVSLETGPTPGRRLPWKILQSRKGDRDKSNLLVTYNCSAAGESLNSLRNLDFWY